VFCLKGGCYRLLAVSTLSSFSSFSCTCTGFLVLFCAAHITPVSGATLTCTSSSAKRCGAVAVAETGAVAAPGYRGPRRDTPHPGTAAGTIDRHSTRACLLDCEQEPVQVQGEDTD